MRLQLWNVRGEDNNHSPLPPAHHHHHHQHPRPSISPAPAWPSLPMAAEQGGSSSLSRPFSFSMTDDSIKSMETWLSSEVTVTFTDQRRVDVGGWVVEAERVTAHHHLHTGLFHTALLSDTHTHNRFFHTSS